MIANAWTWIWSQRDAISWIGSGLVVMGGGGWAIFTYLRPPDHRKPEGIPSAEVVKMIQALMAQAGVDRSRGATAAEPASPVQGDRGYSVRVSKFLSLVLRHRPSAAFLAVKEDGWADVGALLRGVNAAGYPLTLEELARIVRLSVGDQNEQRFSLSPDQSRIRANWGRTI